MHRRSLLGIAAAALLVAAPTLFDTPAFGAQGKRVEHSQKVRHAHLKKVRHAYRPHRMRAADCWRMPWHWACTPEGFAIGAAPRYWGSCSRTWPGRGPWSGTRTRSRSGPRPRPRPCHR